MGYAEYDISNSKNGWKYRFLWTVGSCFVPSHRLLHAWTQSNFKKQLYSVLETLYNIGLPVFCLFLFFAIAPVVFEIADLKHKKTYQQQMAALFTAFVFRFTSAATVEHNG